MNDKEIEKFINDLFNTKNIDLRKENIRAKLDEMLDKEDYSKLIKLGADKIRNW